MRGGGRGVDRETVLRAVRRGLAVGVDGGGRGAGRQGPRRCRARAARGLCGREYYL